MTETSDPRLARYGQVPPADNHRWLSLRDEAGDNWLFDVTFLQSNYQCIYGKGCPGIGEEPDPDGVAGCCVHGAYFVDDEDRKTTASYVARLEAQDWQLMDKAADKGSAFKKLKTGEWTTRRHKDACIFQNRADFEGGPGCALHRAALRHGERPVDWKPDVCWQVPIRLDVHTHDTGHDTVFIKAWDRQDWDEGGKDFHWWCIEEAAAYTADEPVYLGARDELVEMVGQDLYARLVSAMESIERETPVSLKTQ